MVNRSPKVVVNEDIVQATIDYLNALSKLEDIILDIVFDADYVTHYGERVGDKNKIDYAIQETEDIINGLKDIPMPATEAEFSQRRKDCEEYLIMSLNKCGVVPFEVDNDYLAEQLYQFNR